jgi:hypothetical protein
MRLARLLVGIALTAACVSTFTASPTHADTCGQAKPPLDAASKQVGRGNMLWISRDGTVGITTPGGTGVIPPTNAGPLPLQAFLVDAQQDGNQQLIVSNGRTARLYTVSGCEIAAVTDPQGVPFAFDMEDVRGSGTGVGCVDLGEGRHLVGFLGQPADNGYTIRRTQINLNGNVATPGKSDTVAGQSQQASTISCGDLTLAKDGVKQP